MLGLGGNQAPMNNGALNLGVQSQQAQMPMQSQNPWANQQVMGAGQSPLMQGMFGGQQNQFTQQPITPPTELEIQIMLLRGISPIERFVASPQMGTLVEMFSTLVSFSVLEVLRNASFIVDEETGLKIPDETIKLLKIQKDATTKQLIRYPELYYAKSSFPLEISQRSFDFLWRMCESYELWCKESKQSELLSLNIID